MYIGMRFVPTLLYVGSLSGQLPSTASFVVRCPVNKHGSADSTPLKSSRDLVAPVTKHTVLRKLVNSFQILVLLYTQRRYIDASRSTRLYLDHDEVSLSPVGPRSRHVIALYQHSHSHWQSH